ncbi:MAG: hypothetical protein K6E91_03535 [Butyrivibrio sp.]|nr:hypothetical protein [Butyrivibrio sp.]
MNEKVAMGVTLGIMVGLVICVILFRFANKDKRIKTQYDERQEVIRGRGYRFGFYTMLFLEVVLMMAKMAGLVFPIEEYLIHMVTILIGTLVICIHSIWNGVYWGINNDHKRYYIIFIVAIVLNLIPVASSLAHSTIATKGFDSLPMLNVLVLIWMAVIGITALVKKLVDSVNKEED